MKTTYKVLAGTFQGHPAGEEFEADLDQAWRRARRHAARSGLSNKRRRRRRRPMPKRIALKDAIDGRRSRPRATSPGAFRFTSEHERVDVSGFNPTGANEYLAGATEQSVEVEFYGSYGASEVHATLYPIHRDREVVAFAWRPDGSTGVSATNPSLEGNVQLLTYSPGGHPRRSGNVDGNVHRGRRGRPRLRTPPDGLDRCRRRPTLRRPLRARPRGAELTTREWGWLKRLAGYLPSTLEDGLTRRRPRAVLRRSR